MAFFKNIFLFCFLVLATGQLSAQGFLQTQGKDIVDENGNPFILKGMGLGGWMLQEGYMLQTAGFASAQYQIKDKIEELIGEEDTEAFYDAWLANHVQKKDIDALKAWGFNSVRLPMHYNLFTLPIEEEPVEGVNTWLDKGFVLTDSLISWCKQNEMYVVLDLHAAPGGQGYDQAISDYDPSKPSIWESVPNRRKAASLWKRIAERYADEPWVAGYDLLNEPNWDLGGNTALRLVYFQMTDSIRAVDQKHMIFVEGNWFANDFTGLTPPWDDNMVYSPHKYWSTNDQASIQWVLEMREEHNVPLYLGETGENSNTWFHDAIELFDEHNIGWAWWPMKKVESIAGPLSIIKSDGYQTLLDYWNNGGTAPTAAYAKNALMQLTEDLKFDNCTFQKDVIDAMFRQQGNDETIAFSEQNIPGQVYVTDFDLGKNGFAYQDTDVANYNVSTGNFTSWNNGWIYRNDGVDLEASTDPENDKGVHVGWLNTDEWMQYEVNVASTAIYDIELRIASNVTGGQFHFSTDGATLTPSINTPNTGGWQNWETITVENVVLNAGTQKLRFHVDNDGFNLGNFNFIEKGSTTMVDAVFLSASTVDENNVQLSVNKSIAEPLPSAPAGFEIQVNGSAIPINSVAVNAANSRLLDFNVDYTFKSTDVIRISYNSTDVLAEDGTALTNFSLEWVDNNILFIHAIPGKIEAEDFFAQSGIQLENTSDIGGGQNIGFLDPGDYIDYYISVAEPGAYAVNYRTAAESEVGGVTLQLIDDNGNASDLHTVTFPSTGGWQTWANTTKQAYFANTGTQHLRITITQPLFNINWLEFDFLSSTHTDFTKRQISVFPNPSTGQFYLFNEGSELQNIDFKVYNNLGVLVHEKHIASWTGTTDQIDLSHLDSGSYHLIINDERTMIHSSVLIHLGN